MIQYGLMKERVPDVDLGRAKTAIAELTKAFPPDSINPAVKCFARCGAGGYIPLSIGPIKREKPP